jgi:hypothetical protein
VQVRRALAVLGCALALGSCALGERPYFSDDPLAPGTATGDADIDALLSRMDGVAATQASYVATYSITVLYGGTSHTATAAGDGARTSTTIDGVRFISESGGNVQTCTLATGECSPGLMANMVSNTMLTPDFWASDSARRLRRDAQAKVAPTRPYDVTIADQPASCVDVSVTGGVATYCVFQTGVLAKLVDGDVNVDATSYGGTPGPELFSTTG